MNKEYKCRSCDSIYTPFMSLGNQPIANGFLKENEFNSEYFYELLPGFCESCGLFQIAEQPDPDKMFHSNYAFFTGTSMKMIEHFTQHATKVCNFLEGKTDPLVVEIGSNDGTFLKNIADKNIRHVGVEPSENVANNARDKGVNTIVSFFNDDLVNKIIEEYGHADVLVASNVICHIPDIRKIVELVSKLLKKDGVFIFEEPYLGSMIEKTSFDQIYDEHVFIFSAISVSNLFSSNTEYKLFHAEPLWTHGGSMRYFIGREEFHKRTNELIELTENEINNGLNEIETYHEFKNKCEEIKNNLLDILKSYKNDNKRITGYGATSKSTTVLNYAGIDSSLIDYILDVTPIKQGKYSPGMHIPIVSPDDFYKNYPDYAVLFAWNHAEEIMQKENEYVKNGGKWITFFPEVKAI